VPDVKILGIAGSLRQASFNRFALRAAKLLAELVAWTQRLRT